MVKYTSVERFGVMSSMIASAEGLHTAKILLYAQRMDGVLVSVIPKVRNLWP